MSQQTTFRLVFAALFLFLFGLIATYQRKALAGRRIDYSQEGLAMLTEPALHRTSGSHRDHQALEELNS